MNTKKRAKRRDVDGRILYDGPEEIPEFTSEAEAAAWYRSHTPSDAYAAKAVPMNLEEAIAWAEREARAQRTKETQHREER
jgi:hypothetical protein